MTDESIHRINHKIWSEKKTTTLSFTPPPRTTREEQIRYRQQQQPRLKHEKDVQTGGGTDGV